MADKKKSFADTIEAEIFHEAAGYVKDKVKRKILKIGEVSISFLTAFLLIIVGMVELIGTHFPILQGGYNYLLFGVFFLVAGMILKQ